VDDSVSRDGPFKSGLSTDTVWRGPIPGPRPTKAAAVTTSLGGHRSAPGDLVQSLMLRLGQLSRVRCSGSDSVLSGDAGETRAAQKAQDGQDK
jgi:hypothetical protein